MSNHSIMDENLNEDQLDSVFKSLVRSKFDQELRNELEHSLHNDHKFSKGGLVVSFSKKKRSRVFYLIPAAAVVLILLTAFPYIFQANDPQVLADNFLTKTEVYHSAATKGTKTEETTRQEAINAFNKKDYLLAEQYYSQIENKTEEDNLYTALSFLYNKKYAQGIPVLEVLERNPESKFQIEARWFLSIAYVLNGEEDKAKSLLQSISAEDWNYKKAKKMLRSLK
ncbi:MAG: hypothetical protein AAFO07_15580 [Bacteroidota bacterium]